MSDTRIWPDVLLTPHAAECLEDVIDARSGYLDDLRGKRIRITIELLDDARAEPKETP